MGDLPHDPDNTPVRWRFTSVYGDVVETEPIQMVDLPLGQDTAYAFYDTGVQFTPRPVAPGACTINRLCGNKQWDDGEVCEMHVSSPADCATLDAGTGQAPCDPFTCDWDTSFCQ
jgi:hypothetical protein